MKTTIEHTYFTTFEGLRFFCRRSTPEKPKALVFIVHGLGEHSGRYDHVIDYFSAQGYAVAAFDFRGHGQSDGWRGDIRNFIQWVDDARMLMWESKRTVPSDTPVFVVGHSLGGLIALSFAAQYASEIDGLVISSPSIVPTVEVHPIKMWLGTKLGKAMPRAPIDTELNPEYLSRDPAVVKAYADDPLVLKRITLRTGNTILNTAKDSMSLAYSIKTPVLMIQGKGDRICSPDDTKKFYEAIPGSSKQLNFYDGSFHEPFNDIVKEAVLGDVESWIRGVLASSSTSRVSVGDKIHDHDTEEQRI